LGKTCAKHLDLKIYFLVAPFGYLYFVSYILFPFNYWMNQDWVQESILAWIWHHFHLTLDETQTHNLPIVSQVCWPQWLYQTFARKKIWLKLNQFCLKLFNGLFPHDNKEVQWFSTFLKSQNFWNIFKHLAEPGVNFINILQTDPESAKKTVKSSVFCSFGISASKSFS